MGKKAMDSVNVLGILSGTAVTVVTAIVSLALLTGTILAEKIQENRALAVVACICAFSTFAGGVVGRKMSGNKNAVTPIGVAAIFVCLQLIVGMLLFEGRMHTPILIIAVSILGCILACVTGRKQSKGRTNGRKRYR